MAQCRARRHGFVALGTLQQQQHSPLSSSAASSLAKKIAPIQILSTSGDLMADLEGDVRSTLGESYIDGARRQPCVTGVRRSIQEEEEKEEPGADGDGLGFLMRDSWWGARHLLS